MFHNEGGFPNGTMVVSIPTYTYKTVTLEAGKDYYFRLSMVGGSGSVHLEFDSVEPGEAVPAPAHLKPLEARKIYAAAVTGN